MRFACGDMRDHIVSYQNDHRPSYWRRRALRQQARLRIDFSEILRVVRFSTFATISATNGLMRRSIALSSFKSSSPGWIAHRCSLLRPCALRPRSFRRPPLDVDGCYEPFNLAVIADQPQTRTWRT